MSHSTKVKEPAPMKDRIRQIRKGNHLSQVELAKKLGVSQSVISLIESGHASVSVEILKRISAEFDVSCDWLIYGKEPYVRLSPNNNFLPLVQAEAEAGYISQHSDPEYASTLDLYKIPGFENGEFRIFVVDGDSMLPTIHPHDKVICEKLPEPFAFVEGTINVVVTKANILVKRVYFWKENKDYIVLNSDNRHYTEERIPTKDVSEMWAVRAKLTSSFIDESYAQNERMDTLERDLHTIKDQVSKLLKRNGGEEPLGDDPLATSNADAGVFNRKKNK